jgi:hypothetical protein
MQRACVLAFISILSLGLQSCDPSLSLDLVNKTGSPVSVKIIQSPPHKYFHPDSQTQSESDTAIIQLSEAPPKSVMHNVYHLGTWKMSNNHNLNDLVGSVKFVEIKTRNETIIYNDSIQILHLFWSNIQGRTDEKIVINIE